MVLGRLPLYGEPEVSPDCSPASSLSAEEIVVVYHERTKHHYHRFAASVGYMDWATQPDPFRCYEGASLVRLPFPKTGQALPYWQLYVADSMEPAPLSIDSVSLFLRYALSLTAWKRFHETTWSLRANPSSGNLHPTEGYALRSRGARRGPGGASIRSTGIGCYFDDPVHEVFGIFSRDWQSFYHFTVGGPVEEKRLTILPAYKLENEP